MSGGPSHGDLVLSRRGEAPTVAGCVGLYRRLSHSQPPLSAGVAGLALVDLIAVIGASQDHEAHHRDERDLEQGEACAVPVAHRRLPLMWNQGAPVRS